MFWFLLICDILTPLIMIIAGRIMWKNPPKNINGVVGYRTKRSMANVVTWRFANEYCGILWFKGGVVMLPLSIIAHIPFYGASENTLGVLCIVVVTVQVLVLFLSIFFVERALKNTFGN